MESKRIWLRRLTTVSLATAFIAGVLSTWSGSSGATVAAQQSAESGAIAGSVTADRGEVRALRVKARDTVRRISYTVYTRNGRYQIFNLPAGQYEVRVIEEAFESPVQTIELSARATQTVNINLKARVRWHQGVPMWGATEGVSVRGTPEERSESEALELVDFATLYPPGPSLDLMRRNGCFGCHAGSAYYRRTFHQMGPRSEAQWRHGVERMFDPNGRLLGLPVGAHVASYDRISQQEKESIVQYLTANFGPSYKKKDLKTDVLRRDENALAEALYVQYELNVPRPSGHTVNASTETPGVIWMSGLQNSSIVRIDTRDPNFSTRTKEWVSPHPDKRSTLPHGIVERRGRVWWSEMAGDRLGEFDTKTEEIRMHTLPTVGGAAHDPWPDSEGNVWYTYWTATGKIGRLNGVTKEFKEWNVEKGFAGYGVMVDKEDRVWAVGLNTPLILMYNPRTDKWTSYSMSNPGRRVTLDSKGKVWVNQYQAGIIAMLDPGSGKVTEYPMPLKYETPYEVWADAADNLWIEDATYNSLVRFDQKTKQFTHFPFPELSAHTFKVSSDRRVFSGICGSFPAPVADPTYGTGRFPSTDTSESRMPFWQSVSLCC